MWILPKNYQPSSAFVRATLESKEDLTLLESDIESSLTARSKAMPLRTWSRKWNRVSWIPHLFTRILKPSHQSYFEEQLTLSLAGIRVSRSQRRVKGLEKKTQDTSGPTSESISTQYSLLESSSKMSKDTSRWDSPASSATWKKIVTEQRGEYSQRVKSALLIKESESISWPTPTVQDSNKATKKMRDNHQNNLTAVVFSKEVFPTPTSRDYKGGYKEEALTRKDGKSRRFDALPNAAIGGVGTDIVPGHLNPEWVEWLMGVPIGLTGLDF